MKYLFLLIVSLAFVSCETPVEPEKPAPVKEIEDAPIGTLEEVMVRHMESKLGISAIEKYDYKIYKEEITRDDSTDWIVTINLYDRAINEAIDSDQTAKMAELDYFGNYNYFFFMDGNTKKISPAIVVPSCAPGELRIGFDHITSQTTKDFVVDLKIRNSRRRRFYTIFNNTPLQIGEEVLYYNLGKQDAELETYVIEYEEVENSAAKNILVYEGQMEQVEFEKSDEIYTYEPTIKSTGKLVRKWYYNAQHKKFFMKNTDNF